MTERIDTWPISVRTESGRTFLGVFDRLGEGTDYPAADMSRTLEEIGGDDWTAAVLACLLPRERVWAWWTQTSVLRKSGLTGRRAPKTVQPSSVTNVLLRSLLLRRMTVAIVPSADSEAQAEVLRWAGMDTEQIPDHIWTAAEPSVRWNVDQIISWCDDPERWGDPQSVAQQPAERIVTMFDNQIFCAVDAGGAEAALKGLEALARAWGLRVVPGPPSHAWAAPRRASGG